MNDKKPSYGDANLSLPVKKVGEKRLLMPNKEGAPTQRPEDPYPGRENRAHGDFERPDEFGDGDRRS